MLVGDGASGDLLKGMQAAAKAEGALVEIVAPMVGGVEADDGSLIEGDKKLDGGPSVLFDAVAVLLSVEGAALLTKHPVARDFVADAYAHCKFIAYSAEAMPLFEKAGIAADMDEGFFRLGSPADAMKFIKACGELRLWKREAKLL